MTQTAAELEELIRSGIDDPAPWRVYADWLQSRGDPRGELIALQLRRESAMNTEARRRLEEAEAKLLHQHEAVLFGPITPALFRYEMRRGFVSALGNAKPRSGDNRAAYPAALESALQHPACRFLREYMVHGGTLEYMVRDGTEGTHVPALEVLGAHRPSTLDRVSMWSPMDDDLAAATLAAVPRLKHLRVRTFNVHHPAVFPEAVSLRLSEHPSALLEFPKLESIDAGTIDPHHGLPEFLNSDHFPRLRRASFGFHGGSDLWRELVESKVVRQLKELGVRTFRLFPPELVDELARALLQYSAHLRHLERFMLFTPEEHRHLFGDLQSALGEKLRLMDLDLIVFRQSLEFEAQWWTFDDLIAWDDPVPERAGVETSPVQPPIRRRRPGASD